jgi:hypothetical protein
VLALSAATVEAQVSRVFVSVTGNDANVCSNISTPCRTFGGGITQVDAEGEVIVIESGSYAGASITKPVKINVAAGVVAFSAQPITINVAAGATVVLRGITLKALTPGTGQAILVFSGDLIVENSVIDGWEFGVATLATSRVAITHSTLRNNVIGVQPTEGTGARFLIADSELFKNAYSVQINAGNFGRFSRLHVSGGTTGFSCGGSCDISETRIWDEGYGITALATATVRLNRVEITGCGTAVNGGAVWESFGNNAIKGNTADFGGGAMLAPVALQ